MDKQQREYIHHLMLQYSDAMVRLTYRRVGDWHLAEDLVQETFLTACCKSERVCGHKKPVAWLFETLNNLTFAKAAAFIIQRFRLKISLKAMNSRNFQWPVIFRWG